MVIYYYTIRYGNITSYTNSINTYNLRVFVNECIITNSDDTTLSLKYNLIF